MSTHHPRQRRSPPKAPTTDGKHTRERRQGYAPEFPDFKFDDPVLQETIEKVVSASKEREGMGNDKRNAFITVDELVRAGVIAVVDGKVVKAP